MQTTEGQGSKGNQSGGVSKEKFRFKAMTISRRELKKLFVYKRTQSNGTKRLHSFY